MKKLLSLVLILSLLLCGCYKTPVHVPTDPPPAPDEPIAPNPPADVPEVAPPVFTQQPMLAVSTPATTEYFSDEKGNTLFSHTYQTMQLTTQDPEVADKIIIDFLARIDQSHMQAQLLHQQALSSATLDAPYALSTLYSPMRIDQNVLSLYGATMSYSGGIHPDHNCTGASYSMLTGDVLTLGGILTDVNALTGLCELVLTELRNNKDTYQLIGGYEAVVKERLLSNESYNEDWYFSPSGLCILFPPYEIAPYASGVISVEIPYENLSGIIADDFFPPETEYPVGDVSVVRWNDAEIENFNQIAEINIDADGEAFLLYTENTVYDVRLEVGSWSPYGDSFFPEYTAFASRSLTPGDAIIARVYFPDVLPAMRLVYKCGAETKYFFLAQSGKDGSIYLSDQ